MRQLGLGGSTIKRSNTGTGHPSRSQDYLMSYWHDLQPEYASKKPEDPDFSERFMFTQCDC
jgi:hypothetical protein